VKLSDQQVRFFRHSGYLRLDGRLSAATVDRMGAAMERDAAARVPPLRCDTAGRVTRLDAITSRDSVFREVFTCPLVLEPLVSLLGPNIELTLNRHNHATFNRHGENPVRLHRDVLQWSRAVATVLVYVDPATEETGCTHVVPGSHLLPFVGTPNNGGTWMDEHSVYADLIGQAIPVPMPSGGILMLDSLAFHTVGNNRSDRARRSACCGYHSVDELSGTADDPKKLLVAGERLYRGNDGAR
jgi:phytanoyl-CoA hydroxylase